MRHPLRGPLLAALLPLNCALAPLALTPSAFAQEDAAPAPPPDAPTAQPATAPDETLPPLSGESTTADRTSTDGISTSTRDTAETSAEADAPVESPQPPAKVEPVPTKSEVPDAAHSGLEVTLEVVPRSGYPAWQVRGIDGGSLAATMHGMQWPYLPTEGDHSALRVGVSGYMWNDLSYARIESGLEESYPNQKRLATQTRGVLRLSPTFSTPSGWFTQGQYEAVGHGDLLIQNSNLASTDDLYVRFGKWKLFDITAGRFQGWEIANHYGMGLDINTHERVGAAIETQPNKPASSYGLTYFWDRKDGRLGHYAAHIYPTNYLRFEMLAELGTGTEGILRQTNFRPTGIFDIGFLKVKGGFEYGTAVPQGDGEQRRIYRNGFGGAVQFVFTPWLEGGVHFARGYEDLITIQGVKDVLGSNTVTGYGGFLNGRPIDSLVIGIGYLDSHWENLSRNATPGDHYGDHDTNDQVQQFVAVQYDLYDQLYLKLVGSHAKFDFYESSSTPFTNEMWGLRFRTAVAF